jgi:hypothetical protein
VIVTPDKDRRNRRVALLGSALAAALIAMVGLVLPLAFAALPAAAVVYWWSRRRTLRRKRVAARPFPTAWERVLSERVVYYVSLDPTERERFRNLVSIFLDEVRVTGIRAEVDDVVLALVGASAVIPIFGFPDWEYARLGEVLIYPGSFSTDFEKASDAGGNTLGMVGMGHLRGVMILSRPDLLAGFERYLDRENVGVHEFTHLVDAADGVVDGVPPGVPSKLAHQWAAYVAAELRAPHAPGRPLRPYAYTNEAEFLAVVAESFFERPDTLREKAPELYEQLELLFRQDTETRLAGVRLPRRRKIGRNAPCPCGSGRKYKRCCLEGKR